MSALVEETPEGLKRFKLGDAFETTPVRNVNENCPDGSCTGDSMIAEARKYNHSLRCAYQRQVKITERGEPACIQCFAETKRREKREDVTEAISSLALGDKNVGEYIYETLPDADAIRILELHPATDYEAPLEATLALELRRDRIHYAALSYTWGGVETSGLLHLGYAQMDIQGNLDLALRAMRRKDEILRIWVDAYVLFFLSLVHIANLLQCRVCINQKDLAEKAIQVAQMDDIYRRAESVFAWLGPSSETSEGALEYLDILAELSKSPEYDQSVRPQAAILEMTSVSIDADLASKIRESRESTKVDEVFKRLWFSRIWVVQEVLLAKNLVLHIGDHTLPWDQFRRAVHMLWAAEKHHIISGLQVTTGSSLRHAQGLVYARDQLQANNIGTTLFQDYTMQIYARTKELRTWGCKDDRDRVYGILGFIPQDSSMVIIPDYTIDSSEVYIEFARQHVLHEGLTILLFAGLEQRTGPTLIDLEQFLMDNLRPGEELPNENVLDKPEFLEKLYLPTWVPELRPDRMNQLHRAWLPQTFNAALGLTPSVVLHKQCRHHIAVRGCAFDKIEQLFPISTVLKDARTCNVELMTYLETLLYLGIIWKEITRHFSNHGVYPTGESPSAVFDGVVTAGRTCPKILNASQSKDVDWIDRMLDLVKSGSVFDIQSPECKAMFQKGSDMQMNIATFFSCVSFLFYHDQFIITEEGYMGLVPKCSVVGDYIAWVDGLQSFLVLRHSHGGQFQIVGPCFLHGVMNGELSEVYPESDFIEII